MSDLKKNNKKSDRIDMSAIKSNIYNKYYSSSVSVEDNSFVIKKIETDEDVGDKLDRKEIKKYILKKFKKTQYYVFFTKNIVNKVVKKPLKKDINEMFKLLTAESKFNPIILSSFLCDMVGFKNYSVFFNKLDSTNKNSLLERLDNSTNYLKSKGITSLY